MTTPRRLTKAGRQVRRYPKRGRYDVTITTTDTLTAEQAAAIKERFLAEHRQRAEVKAIEVLPATFDEGPGIDPIEALAFGAVVLFVAWATWSIWTVIA